jgi:hypothetical protein
MKWHRRQELLTIPARIEYRHHLGDGEKKADMILQHGFSVMQYAY